ncbi:MAG: hypothetical protein J6S08_03560 [Duodenibacillus sp.]|nr:hypothetical protein [Duodenibacillus sp.]
MSSLCRYLALFALAWLVMVLSVDANALKAPIAEVLPHVEASRARALYEVAAWISGTLCKGWMALETATTSGGVGAEQWASVRESILPSAWVLERLTAIGNTLWLAGLRAVALAPAMGLVALLILASSLDARVAARRRRLRLQPAAPATALAAAHAAVLAPLGATLLLTLPVHGAETLATSLMLTIAPSTYWALSRRPVVTD